MTIGARTKTPAHLAGVGRDCAASIERRIMLANHASVLLGIGTSHPTSPPSGNLAADSAELFCVRSPLILAGAFYFTEYLGAARYPRERLGGD